MAGVLGRSGQGPAEGCGYNDGVRVAARDVGDRIGSDYLGGMMLYESLTELERIAWDLAGSKPQALRDLDDVCAVCQEDRIYDWDDPAHLVRHNTTCPYRRAVEWKAELIARWEAER